MEERREQKGEIFEYTYSAPTEREKKQIESIRKQYAPQEQKGENAFKRLKALDAKVRNTARLAAWISGVVGILLFGLGLTMVLEWSIRLWGIALMVFACIPMASAYPIHSRLLARGKKKYGAEIVRLSDDLLHNTDGKKTGA